MTDQHTDAPWWASGRGPEDGLDDSQDPFDAHHDARRGAPRDDDPGPGGRPGDGADTARLASDAIDLVARLAAEAGRRVTDRARTNAAGPPPDAFTRDDPPPAAGGTTGSPHPDGQVCDACPFCIALRALRQVRPEVVGHLSDAAHHLSLALRAFADAQAGGDDRLEKIDLDQ